MKKLALLSLLIVLITSCSDAPLSRSEATATLQSLNTEVNIVKKAYSHDDQDNLAAWGYLSWKDRRWGNNFSGGTIRENYVLVDLAKEHLLQTEMKKKLPIYYFKIGTRRFGSVTGIQQNPKSNEAIVEYTIEHSINDFGKRVFGKEDNTENNKVRFIRYDDGWRIDEN